MSSEQNKINPSAQAADDKRLKEIREWLRRAQRSDRDDVPQEPHVRAYYKELKQAEKDIDYLLSLLPVQSTQTNVCESCRLNDHDACEAACIDGFCCCADLPDKKPIQPAASAPTEAVCPECGGRAGLDFHDKGCGFDKSGGKEETPVVASDCTWKPILARCIKCSHRGDIRRTEPCPTCGCECEFTAAASTEAQNERKHDECT